MNPFRPPGSPARTPVLASIPAAVGNGSVSLRLYDPIDSWGGEWGVSAKEFAAAIDAEQQRALAFGASEKGKTKLSFAGTRPSALGVLLADPIKPPRHCPNLKPNRQERHSFDPIHRGEIARIHNQRLTALKIIFNG